MSEMICLILEFRSWGLSYRRNLVIWRVHLIYSWVGFAVTRLCNFEYCIRLAVLPRVRLCLNSCYYSIQTRIKSIKRYLLHVYKKPEIASINRSAIRSIVSPPIVDHGIFFARNQFSAHNISLVSLLLTILLTLSRILIRPVHSLLTTSLAVCSSVLLSSTPTPIRFRHDLISCKSSITPSYAACVDCL